MYKESKISQNMYIYNLYIERFSNWSVQSKTMESTNFLATSNLSASFSWFLWLNCFVWVWWFALPNWKRIVKLHHFLNSLWIQVPPKKILYPPNSILSAFLAATWNHRDCLLGKKCQVFLWNHHLESAWLGGIFTIYELYRAAFKPQYHHHNGFHQAGFTPEN